MSLLEVHDLDVAYDSVMALRRVSLSVKTGEVVTVLGANGAGKSTLLKAIIGLVPAQRGWIVFDGAELRGGPPDRLQRGITLCPEGRRLFPDMTVMENIRMGAYASRDRASFKDRFEQLNKMFPKLADRAGQTASSLSGGEQQMVAIARALMSRPRLLLLDEPTLGLAPKMIHEVARLVKLINAEGTAVVLVEQNARLALRISDRGYVLENGEVSLEGPSSELLGDEHVQRIYLGG